jgi:hypothetical protein
MATKIIPEKTTGEVITDAVEGHDQPMEKEHPYAPAAMVMGTYPMILLGLIIAFVLYLVISSMMNKPVSDSEPRKTIENPRTTEIRND